YYLTVTCLIAVSLHSSYLCFMIFFSSSYVLHRDLHSFPTRRSSDLTRLTAASTASTSPIPSRTATWSNFFIRALSCAARPYLGRSEEHTSELQSRFDLVCRLLLEKKNLLTHTFTHCINTHNTTANCH